MLWLLCTAVTFLFIDQSLMAPNLSAIAEEFGFSEEEKNQKLGADIAIGFFVIGGAASIIGGFAADVFQKRCLILGGILLVTDVVSASVYWSTTYSDLFALRILTGMGVGASLPLIYSLLGDLFPSSERVTISGYFGVFSAFGVAMGQFIAGFLCNNKYFTMNWRAPFILTAIPAALCAVWFLIVSKEPVRGSQEDRALRLSLADADIASESIFAPYHQQDDKAVSDSAGGGAHASSNHHSLVTENAKVYHSEEYTVEAVVNLFSIPSVALIVLQGVPGCIPWGMLYTYFNDFLSTDAVGLSVIEATFCLSAMFAMGVCGQICGGQLGQWLYNHEHVRRQITLMGLSTVLSALPVLIMVNSSTHADGIGFRLTFLDYFALSSISGFLMSVNAPNIRATLQVL